MKTQPTIEYGYRFLQPGEIVQTGDDLWLFGNRWGPAKESIGSEVSEAFTGKFRRPVDPGSGYRLVGVNEPLQRGDEIYYADPDRWIKTNKSDETPGEVMGVLCEPDGLAYRRKVITEPTIEYGYRILESGETIQDGDEIWNCLFQWSAVNVSIGSKVVGPRIGQYRRAINPGTGYRLVRFDETFVPGDEFFDEYRGKWSVIGSDKTNPTPRAVFNAISNSNKDALAYRRKVETQQVIVGGKVEDWKKPYHQYGYRMLTAFETPQPGDEFWLASKNSGGWRRINPTRNPSFYRGVAGVRRPINPGPGYRLLDPMEVLRPDDEYHYVGNIWDRTSRAGETIAEVTNGDWEGGIAYRRSVQAVPTEVSCSCACDLCREGKTANWDGSIPFLPNVDYYNCRRIELHKSMLGRLNLGEFIPDAILEELLRINKILNPTTKI